MTRAASRKLPCGLYLILWKQCGGVSIAAVGMCANGDRWLAPTNWLEPDVDGSSWSDVDRAILIGQRKFTPNGLTG